MTAPNSPARSVVPTRRRRWLWLLLLVPPAALAGLTWWFTEPLEDHLTALPTHADDAPIAVPAVKGPVVWPEGRVEGEEAKKILLAVVAQTVERLDHVAGYTATLRKQERMGGVLGPEQTLAMKVRNRPFAIYLKFLAPKAGKEVVYAEGHHDNKVIAHNGDWTRRLVPRLAVAPDSPLALADSRHPVTDAGLVSLSRKLLKFREMDIGDAEAITVLDRTTLPTGKPAFRSLHIHTNPNGGRPFTRVEVLYDPETRFPVQIKSFDWPKTGHTGEPELAEMYAYDDLKLGAPLTAADFDPANPNYAFTRY